MRNCFSIMRTYLRSGTMVAIGIVLPACASQTPLSPQPPWSTKTGQHSEHLSGEVRKSIAGRFLLYLPQGFSRSRGQQYPLLIFLHGSGESGGTIDRVKAHGPPNFLGERPDFPFIVASPQADSARFGFDLDNLNFLLDRLLQQLPIDRDRIYVTGLSMGGIATYKWASSRPGTFAAIAPVSAAWDTGDACLLKYVPIWTFHGAKDDIVKFADGEAMVNAIKACGGDIKFTVYPEIGHPAWEPAYDDPELYAWLLAHHLDHAVAKQATIALQARDQRFKDQCPNVNSERTLRGLIRDFSARTPDYSQMTPPLAAMARERAEETEGLLAKLGTLNGLAYRATEKNGTDMYEGSFANGKANFWLLLQDDGKISEAVVYPTP